MLIKNVMFESLLPFYPTWLYREEEGETKERVSHYFRTSVRLDPYVKSLPGDDSGPLSLGGRS